MNRLPLSFARILQTLHINEAVPYSGFRNKKLLKKFIEDGVLKVKTTGRSKRTIYIEEASYLNNYLQNSFGINNLSEYIFLLENSDATRSDAVEIASNSKLKSKNIFEGFMVNCIGELHGEINGQEILLKPVNGTFIFINAYQTFRIERSITVVGVENFENFKHIEKQKQLFKEIKPLFVFRYQITAFQEWLSRIENRYLHFGDFDLSGIAIYLNEFKTILQERADFFIPENIETLIRKYGNRIIYDKQINILKNTDLTKHKEIIELAILIKKYKKGLEQEILINL